MRFLIIIFSIFTNLVNAQISFLNTYSRDSFDKGEGAVQLEDSSYLITGSSSSFTSSAQAFIMKIDSTGKFLWSRSYGGNETDKGRRIFYVKNDGIYVVGQTNSTGNNFYDAYFFKTDLTGNLLLEKQIGGSDYEDIHDAVMLKDTSFIIVGETYSNALSQRDIYLARLSKNGDVIWSKSIGSSNSDLAESIELYADTTIFISGYQFVADSNEQKAFISQLHIDGTPYWTKYYGIEGESSFRDFNIYKDTIRAVGYSSKNGSTHHNLYRVMLHKDGTMIYDYYEYQTGPHEINLVERFGTNNYILSMNIKDEPSIPTFPNGCDNIFYEYSSNLYYAGNSINVSKDDDDIFNQIIRTSDNGILAVGYTSDNDLVQVRILKVAGKDVFDISVLNQTTSTIVGVNELISDQEPDIYPNPTNKGFYLNTIHGIGEICIYSTTNQLVLKQKITENNELISFENLVNGIYTAVVKTDSGLYRKQIVVIK